MIFLMGLPIVVPLAREGRLRPLGDFWDWVPFFLEEDDACRTAKERV